MHAFSLVFTMMTFVCRMQQQYEEERLQRLVQEEAVKFLWNEVV